MSKGVSFRQRAEVDAAQRRQGVRRIQGPEPGSMAMRWMRDMVAALGLVAVVGGAVYFQRARREEEAMFQKAQTDLRRMELEIKYRAATKTTELNGRGWPVTIDPAWFQGNAPSNPMLEDGRPWVEVAGTQQAEFMHPPIRMAVDKELAAFWYNPYQGVVRARVPVMVSDDKATELYNRINGVSVSSIFVRESVADRPKAVPAKPVTVPGIEEPKSETTTSSAVEQSSTEPAPAADKPVATFTVRNPKHKPAR